MYSTADFFQAVLPEAGLPCIGWLPKPGASGQRRMAHRVYGSLQQLIEASGKIDYTNAEYYFCVSTLREPHVMEGDKKRVRTQGNAYQTRCFVVDIDVRADKPGHAPTKEAALAALEKLIAGLSLPRPIVVDSGYGFHCYWPLLVAIPSAERAHIAKAFLRAAQAISPEAVADSSRVVDTASVLRIPSSFNHKNTPPLPVSIVQWYDEHLDIGKLRESLRAYEVSEKQESAAPSQEGGVALPEFKYADDPVPLADVLRNCDWMRHYARNVATAEEPEWYAVLGLAPFLTHQIDGRAVSGEAIAHILSKGHPNYSLRDTAAKYEQAKTRQTGPTTCSKFQSIADRCGACPFREGVKSPVQVGRLDRPATTTKIVETTVVDDRGNKSVESVELPVYPHPYFRGEKGGVYVKGKDSEAGFDKVYDYDVYPTKRYRTEGAETEQVEVHFWLPKDGLRRVKLPAELLVDHKKLGAFLASKGMVTQFNGSMKLARFMTHYVRHMQKEQAAEIEFSRFGWRDVLSAEPKFVVGNGYIDRNGELKAGTYAAFLRKTARSVATYGMLEAWKQAFNVYKGIPNSEAYQMTALMGFAAPLLALTQYSGVLYNMVGDTAAGKSTALRFMTSVWGEPNPNIILPNDTQISQFNTIGYLSSIPVAFDELTKMDPDALSNFVLSFTSGRGKQRANRNGQNQEQNVEWETIVCGTSNTSLYDKLAANRKGYSAEAMRVFEVVVPPSSPMHKAMIDEALIAIRDNYGHAGREYIRFILPRLASVRDAVDRAVAILTERHNIRNAERFWCVLLACVQVGGLIAKQKLGLHDYDVNKLVEWALGRAADARETVTTTSSDPKTLLGEFLNSHLDSILRFNDGKPDLRFDSTKPRKIVGRIEAEGGTPVRAWLSSQAMRAYCGHNRVDFAWLRQELMNARVVTENNVAKRLAAGTTFDNPPVKCWLIDLRHPDIFVPELPAEGV